MKNSITCRGFTLVEMAVVLVIVGLLVGGFIGTLSSRIETTRYAETKEDLEDIILAIIGYAYKNGGLPCPDADGDGASEINCSAATNGHVPWDTLGLGSGDPWNNHYEYWLDANFTGPFDLNTNTGAGGQVKTRSPDGTTLIPLASSVVAVVFSRGKNGLGAVGVDGSPKAPIPATGHSDEDENGDGDNIFVSRSPTHEDDTTNVGTFDDKVVWISEYELKAKMVQAGVLP
jgi:prepilin-type N-terminal cleavage/methylation domain-containing protein